MISPNLESDCLPSKETDRLELQRNLDSQKSQKQRNVLGQFATPTALAAEMLAYAKTLLSPADKIRFLDPAIGTGSFYAALTSCFEEERISAAQGFEVDEHYGLPSAEFWKCSPLEIHLADFTEAEPPEDLYKPNLIICNPPYVRHHHLNASTKRRLADRAATASGIRIGGLAGLYCYFMAIAHTWLADGGLAGWLIPSEFMEVNYGSSLRTYLHDSVELIRIHRFNPNELQFGDAQVSSSVVWFRKRRPKSNQATLMTYGGGLFNPLHTRLVSRKELCDSSKWSGLATGLVRDSSSCLRLGDLFRIKRGIATGNNNLFVVGDEQVSRLGLPREFLRPVLPSPRHLSSDVVESDSEGFPLVSQRRYLLDCGLAEDDLMQANPPLAAYFGAAREKALATYLCSHRTPWYSQEARPPAPILCTYMGRGPSGGGKPFRFILNRSKATALNVYLMLYPTETLSKAMLVDDSLIERIWRALNEVSPSVLLGEGRVYGGGLYKMEPRELAGLPVDQLVASINERTPLSQAQGNMFRADRLMGSLDRDALR